MTVVIGTAGHIDHGKTTLLRALTGIDADRLPEERRRGMTIDVGYAHLALPDGTELDFVDVPGHDRLVGNMLVGAGEIDAALLVVAADDGPRAQTLEHLALLDAIGIGQGVAAVTKADVAGPARTSAVVASVERLLAGTSLAGSPIVAVSSADGSGIDDLLTALVGLRDRVAASTAAIATVAGAGATRLAIDRVFAVKGRGAVVTGTLRGRAIARGATLRLVPGDRPVRVREIQVHGATVESAGPGRTALLVARAESSRLHRGPVLTDDPAVAASDRLLVRLAVPLPDRARARVHLGTAAADASVGRSGRDALDLPDGSTAAVVRLSTPLAVAAGDRCVLRRTSGTPPVVGAIVLDTSPPRGISRRRQTSERVGRLAAAVTIGDPRAIAAARLDLHGAIGSDDGSVALASEVAEAVGESVLAAVATDPTLTRARAAATRSLRRLVTLERAAATAAAAGVVDGLVADGRLVRDGADVRLPGAARPGTPAGDPALARAMDRLERALGVMAPPGLTEAAGAAGCPPDAVRELERSGRIVVLEPDLAYAATAYREIEGLARSLAAVAPLTPAALRDATGTSRKYVMAILADLDRRGVLRRTDAGHVPGPRAPALPVMARHVTAVILAGGRSSRFGRDKLAEPVEGRPLLHHAIDAVRPLASRILVVGTPAVLASAAPPLPDDVELVHDTAAFEGPLAGLLAGLGAAQEPIVLAVGGDMPSLVAAVLRSMISELEASGSAAVILEHAGRPQPLPMVLRREPALAAAGRLLDAGERRLGALAETLGAHVVREAVWRDLDPDARTMRDVDTEADLR